MHRPALPLLLAVAVASLASAQSTPASRPPTVVVLDPGHGGDDIGVRPPDGVAEKDVVLQVAQRVATAIDAKSNLHAVLTRDTDRQVALDDRAASANRASGAAFISLHVNSAPSSDASGWVIYLPSDPRPLPSRRGEPPNAARPITVPLPGGGSKELPLIGWTAAQQPHADDSRRLAALLAQHLQGSGDTPVSISRAPLRVLAGVAMPAVLLELGYLTTPSFADEVTTEPWQTTVAQAIAEAVADFVSGVEPAADEAR